MAKRLKQKENKKKRRRSLRIQKNYDKEANSKIALAAETKKVKRSNKTVIDDIPFRSPVREIRLNIPASPLNVSNADCYDFELEDEDCRKRLSLSKTNNKRAVSAQTKKKKSAVSHGKCGNVGSKQEIQNTISKRKFISKSETLSSSKKPKLEDITVLNDNKISPVSTDCLRSIKSVMKNSCSLTESGISASLLHDITNVVPVVIVERVTSTPSLTKMGQNGLSSELETSELKKKEKRKLKSKQESASVRKLSLRSASGTQSQSTSEKERSSISSVRSASANHQSVDSGKLDYVDSPMLSPVHKVIGEQYTEFTSFLSPQSDLFDLADYTSSRTSYPETDELKHEPFSVLDISKTYSNMGFGYFDRSIKKKKRAKRLKKSSKKSISHYDVLAIQINQEFDDLEEFQLSID